MVTVKPSSLQRVLIVRLSAIGDILHALPVLKVLKTFNPSLQISWLVEDRFASLLRNVREINNTIEVPRSRWKTKISWHTKISIYHQLLQTLKKHQFDLSIDLQGLTKSGLWPWLANIPLRIGFADCGAREINSWLTNIKISPSDDKKHIIDRNLALLQPLGIKAPEVKLSLPVDELAAVQIRRFKLEIKWDNQPVCLIQPGAGWETKRWPAEYFAQLGDFLINRWGYRVIILWGPGEEQLANTVVSNMRKPVALAPQTNLLELIELIRNCQLFVGGDSGPMHMAAAMQVPVIAIFGASDPIRNGPYGEDHLVLFYDNGRPPSWKRKGEDNGRLLNLTPESVISKIEKFIGQKIAGPEA